MDSSLGIALKAEREKRGLSVRALAELLGCDKSSIVDWEHGRRVPSLEYQAKLAEHFGQAVIDPLFPATAQHMSLRPAAIAEDEWLAELHSLFTQYRDVRNQMHSLSTSLSSRVIEQEAAVLARWSQLWARGLTDQPSGSGVTYKLTRTADGKREWLSNVVETEQSLREVIAGWTPEERAEAARVFEEALSILSSWERSEETDEVVKSKNEVAPSASNKVQE